MCNDFKRNMKVEYNSMLCLCDYCIYIVGNLSDCKLRGKNYSTAIVHTSVSPPKKKGLSGLVLR
jgi:hypothetical protein